MAFLNLTVNVLGDATRCCAEIGCQRHERFGDRRAALPVRSDTVTLQLRTPGDVAACTPERVADARQASEMLICLPCDGREAVDAMTEDAGAARSRRCGWPSRRRPPRWPGKQHSTNTR